MVVKIGMVEKDELIFIVMRSLIMSIRNVVSGLLFLIICVFVCIRDLICFVFWRIVLNLVVVIIIKLIKDIICILFVNIVFVFLSGRLLLIDKMIIFVKVLKIIDFVVNWIVNVVMIDNNLKVMLCFV